jgi:hypothetical protein
MPENKMLGPQVTLRSFPVRASKLQQNFCACKSFFGARSNRDWADLRHSRAYKSAEIRSASLAGWCEHRAGQLWCNSFVSTSAAL